jgi:L-fuculose-phosphate aldolase
METAQAKREVLAAGRELLRRGLVARTWGNVSCRIDEGRFAITPSGRDYENLEEKDIVVVETATLAYEGKIKPSSEKGIHAAAYRLGEDIQFVIHTHQTCATVLSVAGHSRLAPSPEELALLGGPPLPADYALPGSQKLARNVGAALRRGRGAPVLMEGHGALLTGGDRAQAFERAVALEEVCRRAMALPPGGETAGALGEPLNRAVSGAFPALACLKCFNSPAIERVMKQTRSMPALLDDFAQMAGPAAAVVKGESLTGEAIRRIIQRLKGRNAVLLTGIGALCGEKNGEDCRAVMTLVEKNALAYVHAAEFGRPRALSLLDRFLMRLVYTQVYRKKK